MSTTINIELRENVFTSPDSIFEKLEQEIQYLPAEKSSVCIRGKVFRIPRQMAAFGDPGLSYTFSGLTVSCEPWTPLLQEIRSAVEQLSGCSFNFVLVNRYQNGNDCIGQHKDDESDLSKDYPICSVSLGETRKMVFKRPNFKDYCVELKDNSLLIMKEPTNRLWTHGIPRQSEKKGVRLNLTFRKMNPCNKRKNETTSAEMNKREKKDSPGLVFTEEAIPKDMFQIGDCLFVYPSTFRGNVSVHIRRFKKYGKSFYPTSEGVTLLPRWIEFFVNRKNLPCEHHEQFGGTFPKEDKITIQTSDFEHFALTRFKSFEEGEAFQNSITLSKVEWLEMMKRHSEIIASVLDHVYDCMDFYTSYMTFEERDIDQILPESLDSSLGTRCLLELLQQSLRDCLIEKGGLKDPEFLAGELWANHEDSFNSTAFTVEVGEIAESFYYKLWNDKNFLAMTKPAMYVSSQFLKNIQLKESLREVRNALCPGNTFEYFEDVENELVCL